MVRRTTQSLINFEIGCEHTAWSLETTVAQELGTSLELDNYEGEVYDMVAD